MKCIVLAGGSGDRLWPLSRKNYPKQFMEIRKGCSMFQEAVLRNIPYCDEFIVVTNKRYKNIVRAQLRDFQDIKYTVLMEETPMQRAAFIVSILLCSDRNEDFLITTTDNIIEGDYNACFNRIRETVKEKKIAVVGVRSKNVNGGHHYFECVGTKVAFSTKPTKNCYLDCGIMAANGWLLLREFDSVFVQACRSIKINDNVFTVEGNVQPSVFSAKLEKVLSVKEFRLVPAEFAWTRMVDISSYCAYAGEEAAGENVVSVNNKNVEIINRVNNQLIVANGLKNVLIANTRDALYITPVNRQEDIKQITDTYYARKNRFFDETPVSYWEWGIKEELYREGDCTVSRITVFANSTVQAVADENVALNYFVVDGVARLRVGKSAARICKMNDNFTISARGAYEVSNPEKKNLVLIQTVNKRKVAPQSNVREEESCVVKLRPVFREAIWGGDRIRNILNKNTGRLERVAESWELSAHAAGESRIASGKYRGEKFSRFIESSGREQLGWKAQNYDHFPILIKFIDANDNLSIQVHPDDDFALSQENDYGKNEMWYVMDAAPGAFIYAGFNRNVTREEIKNRIRNKTLTEILNKIPVRKGETYFLRAGTVHAIGAGCFVCEIQQSSNITYRLYDYGRIDKNGKPRDLHIEKALQVANLSVTNPDVVAQSGEMKYVGYRKKLLGQCKYFVVTKYDVDKEVILPPSPASFKALVVIDGGGKITDGGAVSSFLTKGDVWFCGCKETVSLKGKMSVLVVTV